MKNNKNSDKLMIHALRLAALLLFLCHGVSAEARPRVERKVVHFSSGTGFFVTKSGHIVTNEHVVRGCEQIMVKSPAVEMSARLLEVDKEYDLALLKSDSFAPAVSTLRISDKRIRKGDELMVMGYPLTSAQTGQYKIAKATVIDVRGPEGEPHWLQFSDAAQKGNSGGPLLDEAGHVIGVVTGKSELRAFDKKAGKEVTLSQSDVAVSLPVLQRFLEKHRIYYQRSPTGVRLTDSYIESRSRDFIVNVQCITGVTSLGR